MRFFKKYWLGVLISSILVRYALAQAPTSQETYIKLPKPVPYVEQSTDSTCWLACASMICGYYGENVTEKQLSDKVYKISLYDRLKKMMSGTLKGDERACLIALSQTEGLIEFTLNQAPKAAGDAAMIVTNSVSGIGNAISSLTNASGTRPANDSSSGTNASLQSVIWNLQSAQDRADGFYAARL